MKPFRFFVFILLCLLGTTSYTLAGYKRPIETTFSPPGWTKKTVGLTTMYDCKPSVCKTEEAIHLRTLRNRFDVEKAIRDNLINVDFASRNSKLNAITAGNVTRYTSHKRIVTKNYAGYLSYAINKKSYGNVYLTIRTIYRKQHGVRILSAAMTSKKSRENMDRFLATVQLR